ncbi:fatty acid synthase, partial [Brachionus plicatilis]
MYVNNCKVLSTEIQGVGSNKIVSDVKKECGAIPCCQNSEGRTGVVQSPVSMNKGIWEQPEIVSELVKLPRVLPFFAKSRQTLEQVMDFVEQNPSDLTVQSLLNAHSTYSPKSFPFRGFCLINGEQKMRQIEQVDDLVQRPVWFLFSGMGVEQWRCGMAREMMKLDSFRRSIMRSYELLKPYGINLIQLITGEQQDRQFIMTGIESY